MQIQREFKPEIVKKLENISIAELEKILGLEEPEQISKISKWAVIAQRIKNDEDLNDPNFKKAWKKVKEGMREVHEHFEFNHDK